MSRILTSQTPIATETQAAPAPAPAAHDKPIAVTGAAGLVGTHVCRELARRGWTIRALVRNPASAMARLAGLPVELRVGDLRDIDALRALVTGTEAVVHLAAIAIERGDQRYEEVNFDATVRLVQAMRATGVRRLIHMSQNGAASSSPYRFLRSKGMAEDAVATSPLDWTILRPSVIVGPEDEFVNVLARLVRLSPLVFPLPGGGTARFQPVSVADVARAVGIVLSRRDTMRKSLTLGGPEPLTLREMAERILAAMETSRWLVGVPVAVLRPVVALAQRVLPNPPVTTSLLDLLGVDNAVADNGLVDPLGVIPIPFAPETLRYLQRITVGEALRSLFTRKGG